MTESPVVTSRPDADIMADIEHSIVIYPPMMNDRHHVSFYVEDGNVTLKGHTRTSITKRYLIETVKTLDGVKEVDASGFYSDEVTRIDIGQFVPNGVFSNVEYGVAILTGSIDDDSAAAALVNTVQAMPSVRAVRSKFMSQG